jgi:hypothetical protein
MIVKVCVVIGRVAVMVFAPVIPPGVLVRRLFEGREKG